MTKAVYAIQNKSGSFWKSSEASDTVPQAHAFVNLAPRSAAMFRILESVRQSVTQDGAILLDVHQGQILSVNVTGARIVELVLRGHDESQIVDEISRAYGADKEIVRRDVVEFLDALGSHRILQPSAEELEKPGGSGERI